MDTQENNRIIFCPDIASPIGKGIIIRKTDQYCQIGKVGSIILPGGINQDFEKKYGLGEVVSHGMDVREVNIGDIVIYQVSTAFRIPNGVGQPVLWKIEEVSLSVIAVLPNLVEARRSSKWSARLTMTNQEICDYLKPYARIWKETCSEEAGQYATEVPNPE